MTIVITRTGKGSALTQGEFDGNYNSFAGINEQRTTTSESITSADQNRTVELTNASAIAVTLDEIATILAAIDTDDFKVTLLNIGAGAVTITPNVADSINNGDSTIVLSTDQYVTLQTDSTELIWNIISSNVSVITEGVAMDHDTGGTGISVTSTYAVKDTLPEITVSTGDIILFNIYFGGTKGGTGGRSLVGLAKNSGTAAILAVSGLGYWRSSGYQEASAVFFENHHGMFEVTTGGTLTLDAGAESAGSNISSATILVSKVVLSTK